MKINQAQTQKSTTAQIRARFDADVERFSHLESGQRATIDAPLVLELVAKVAGANLRAGGTLLDLGCGAGNFTLKVLGEIAPLHCTLVDLSQPMLTRAHERVSQANSGEVTTVQTDMRELVLRKESFDVILAGAVLHHLRGDADWEEMFRRMYAWLRPGGWLFVADLVVFDEASVQSIAWERYGRYLESLGGPDYRQTVLSYIDQEDSPRSLRYQSDLMRSVGFTEQDVLHRHSVFAAYYGRKGA